MKKKLIGFIFAATMLFGMSMTVCAVSDNDVTGNDVTGNDITGNNVTTVSGNSVIAGPTDITMDAAVEKPTLEVTITSGKKVIANPYGLVDATLGLTADETLKGSTIKFENKSNTAIAVGLLGKIQLPEYAEGTATANQVTVASSLSTLKTAKTKQVFVQAEITADGTKKLQTSAGTAAEKALVYSKTGAKMTNAPILAASGDTTADASSEMVLTLTGGTSKSPTSEWTDDDAFEVITTYDLQFGDRTKLSKFK